jgi:hypothetical protein
MFHLRYMLFSLKKAWVLCLLVFVLGLLAVDQVVYEQEAVDVSFLSNTMKYTMTGNVGYVYFEDRNGLLGSVRGESYIGYKNGESFKVLRKTSFLLRRVTYEHFPLN